MKSQELLFNLGFCQINIAFENAEKNLKRIEKFYEKTKTDILVFPELSLSGYEIENRRTLKEISFEKKNKEFKNLLRISRDMNKAIVFGFSEREGNKLFNSSMLIDERGRSFVYRKSHLFFNEKRLFDKGDTGFFTNRVKGAKVGMMICFDWFFPEAMRTISLMGADIVAHPSNLVMPYCQDAMKTRCLENRVFAVTANRIGEEENYKFTGGSRITGVNGDILADSGKKNECIKTCFIDLKKSRSKKINKENDLFKDRRRELYVL